MVYYGSRPTFGDRPRCVEIHVLRGEAEDRNPREPIEAVWLHEYVRPEVRFDGEGDLARQLAEDAAEVCRRLKIRDMR
jgi:FAD synthase